jgi:hypothetical protein
MERITLSTLRAPARNPHESRENPMNVLPRDSVEPSRIKKLAHYERSVDSAESWRAIHISVAVLAWIATLILVGRILFLGISA